MNQQSSVTATGWRTIEDVLGDLTDAQTYRNLLYLFLAFPLGIFYYVILTVGVVVGIALSVILVGLGILVGTVIGIRGIASFERHLANRLLGTAIPAPADVTADGEGVLATAKAYLRASSTWRGLGFVVLKFPVGILSFVLLVSLLGVAIELLLLPLFPGGVFNVEISGWVVAQSFETPTQRAVAVPGGVVLGLVAVHVLNAFARANATIATSLLGPEGDEPVGQSDQDQAA